MVKITGRKAQEKGFVTVEGTGFFVSPRTILTCAHIIPKSGYFPKNYQAANIFWPSGSQQRHLKISSNRNPIHYVKRHDLVLIDIEINREHSYVYWDEDIQVGDELYTYGFPNKTKKIEKITDLKFERVSDNQRFLVIKNMKPGFDGAPLFNKRTRKICGIIKNSYNSEKQFDQGISAKIILKSFFSLKELNQNKDNHRQWLGTVNKLNKLTQQLSLSIPRNLPPRDYTKFIGRQSQLSNLLRRLAPDYNQHIITVNGIGGVGKTSLALEAAFVCLEKNNPFYLNTLIPSFDAIIFASAKRELMRYGKIVPRPKWQSKLQDILYTIDNILPDTNIGIANDIEQQKMRIYEKIKRQRTLLIIDNFETIDSQEDKVLILDFLNQLPAPTKVIITTRESIGGYGQSIIELDELTKKESFELIQQHIDIKAHFSTDTPEVLLNPQECEKIYKHFGGIPLALIYAIGQRANGYPLKTILEIPKDNNNSEDISSFCFEGSVAPLRKTPAHNLLMSLAIFENPPTLQALAAVAGLATNSNNMTKGLITLKRLSLVREKERRYRILPLTREYLLTELSHNQDFEQQARENWIQWYLNFTDEWGGEDWQHWRANYDHLEDESEDIKSVLQWFASQDRYQNIKKLWKNIDNYTDLVGYWNFRLRWWRWLSDAAERHNDEATLVKARIEIAWTLILIGGDKNREEAKRLLTEAWYSRDGADSSIRPHIANHIAVLRMTENKHKIALNWLKQEEKLLNLTKRSSNDRRYIAHQAQIAYYRGEIKYLQGQKLRQNRQEEQAKVLFEEAKVLFQEVVTKGEQSGWERFVNYANNYLADIHIINNKLQEAENRIEKGLKLAEANRESRRIPLYHATYARLEKAKRNYKKARDWASQALEGFQNENLFKDAADMERLLEELNTYFT